MLKFIMAIVALATAGYVARNYSGVDWTSTGDDVPVATGTELVVESVCSETVQAAPVERGEAESATSVPLGIDYESEFRELSESMPDDVDKETPLVLARLLKSLAEPLATTASSVAK